MHSYDFDGKKKSDSSELKMRIKDMIFDELRIPRLDSKKERKDFVSIVIIIFFLLL